MLLKKFIKYYIIFFFIGFTFEAGISFAQSAQFQPNITSQQQNPLSNNIATNELYVVDITDIFSPKRGLQGVDLIRGDTTDTPVILVGYQEGSEIIINSSSLDAKGYGYDLLEKLSRSINVDFEFVEIEDSPFDAVNDGRVDIAGLFSATKERAQDVTFGHVPASYVQFALAVKGDGDGYYYDDPAAINGKTVATYIGNPGNAALDSYLANNNISVEYVYGHFIRFMDLEADYYLIPSTIRIDDEFSTVLTLGLKNLYFFAKKGNEALMNFLDRELYEFHSENSSLHNDLENKYQSVNAHFRNRGLTREEAALLEGHTFKVGYRSDHAPYQSTNNEGNPQGISISVMNMLAEKYNFNVEYIPFSFDDDPSIYEDLDILVSLIGDKSHVSTHFEASDPYTSVEMLVAMDSEFVKSIETTNSQSAFPPNSHFGMLDYLSFRGDHFARIEPDVQITHYQNTDEVLTAIATAKNNAIALTNLGSETVAASLDQEIHYLPLGLPLELNFQISKNLDEKYLTIFNLIIRKIPSREINEIEINEMARYFPEYDTITFLKENIYFIISGIVALLILFYASLKFVRQRSALNVLQKDDITSLSSMLKFTDDVNAKLANSKLNEYELIVLDIDYFRMINNYYGVDKGIEVIKAMAQALEKAYIGTEVFLARRVAEQFLIFKKRSEGRNIHEVVNAYVIPQVKALLGENYSLKLSIGYSYSQAESDNMSILLDEASIAHRKAKEKHETSFEEFTDEMREKSQKALDIIYRMEHALQNKEFSVHYQPKINLANLEIIGGEALVRWIPPLGEVIYPGDFIPVMEENGFISKLEMYVFKEACAFIQKNSAHIKNGKIAINFSSITLSNSTLIKEIVSTLKQYKVSPSMIEIELTESGREDFEDVLPVITKILHKIGFTVAMDDFGAGNTSLNRLSFIEVDVLKLDKVFIDFHEDSSRGSVVVQQVIELAKKLGMKVIAEGIENAHQAKWLQTIQCDIAQGYYFSKAVDEETFTELLREGKKYLLK